MRVRLRKRNELTKYRNPYVSRWPRDKHPEHASALRLRDVHPGKRFVQCTLDPLWPKFHVGTFLTAPFTAVTRKGRRSTACMVKYANGEVKRELLCDMGISRYPANSHSRWRKGVVTIGIGKIHTLPPVIRVHVQKFEIAS